MPNAPTDVGAGAPNLMDYIVNGDGTVTDKVTGLMWQQAVPSTMYAWAGAVAYCPTLRLGGHDDWHLPTEIELVSLVDDSARPPAASINDTAFPGTPANFFWSSSPLAGSPSVAWFVLFDRGTASATGTTAEFHVRCVRR